MTSTAMQLPVTAVHAPVERPVLVTEPIGARSRPAWRTGGDGTVLEHVLAPIRATGASPMLAFHIALDALDLLGLKASAETRLDSLSASEQDRVEIARTLITDSPLSADEAVQARAALERLVSLEK